MGTGSWVGHTVIVPQGVRDKRGWPGGWRTVCREMASSQEDYPPPEGPASGSPIEVQSTCRDSSLPGQSRMPLMVGRAFQLQTSQLFSEFSRSVVSDSLWPHGPGLPVHHQPPELTQTHLHWVGDAIQPSHPLSSPSPPTFNLSQHQGIFQWVSSSHQVIEVLAFQPSVLPGNTQDSTPLELTDGISLHSKGLSKVFSNTTVQKHQFFGTQLSL